MDREAFLDRIAERLGRPRQHRAPAAPARGVPVPELRAPLAGGLVASFVRELEAVGGKALVVSDLAELERELGAELERFGARRIVTWARSELEGFGLSWLFERLGARAVGEGELADAATLRDVLLASDVGVTRVDFAVAATGSVVLTPGPTRPRAVSLLPSLHVALVREAELVPRMGAALGAFATRPNAELPSLVQFITGPSRTSDIENDLTIGVHGPAAVVAVILLNHAAGASAEELE